MAILSPRPMNLESPGRARLGSPSPPVHVRRAFSAGSGVRYGGSGGCDPAASPPPARALAQPQSQQPVLPRWSPPAGGCRTPPVGLGRHRPASSSPPPALRLHGAAANGVCHPVAVASPAPLTPPRGAGGGLSPAMKVLGRDLKGAAPPVAAAAWQPRPPTLPQPESEPAPVTEVAAGKIAGIDSNLFARAAKAIANAEELLERRGVPQPRRRRSSSPGILVGSPMAQAQAQSPASAQPMAAGVGMSPRGVPRSPSMGTPRLSSRPPSVGGERPGEIARRAKSPSARAGSKEAGSPGGPGAFRPPRSPSAVAAIGGANSPPPARSPVTSRPPSPVSARQPLSSRPASPTSARPPVSSRPSSRPQTPSREKATPRGIERSASPRRRELPTAAAVGLVANPPGALAGGGGARGASAAASPRTNSPAAYGGGSPPRRHGLPPAAAAVTPRGRHESGVGEVPGAAGGAAPVHRSPSTKARSPETGVAGAVGLAGQRSPSAGKARPASPFPSSAGSPGTPERSPPLRSKVGQFDWLEELLRPRSRHGSKPAVPKRRPPVVEDTKQISYDELKFDEALGAGSFGAVWKGTYMKQEVAIKQCKVVSREDVEMFMQEMSYLQSLKHPRLVSYLGCCDHAPHVIMVMELMPGGSLHALLFGRSSKQLALAEQLRMASEVSEGLTYLHELSVVHRDLKTLNIVLDLSLSCKICDFGLTITLERTHLTVAAIQGSPRYLAPEQLEPPAKITEKVDIWQLGCVFLELFCRVSPFANCTGIQQIITELLIRKRAPAVPVGTDLRVRTLVHACLRLTPQARPSSSAIEEALAGLRRQCASSAPSAVGRT
eukprot:TRINITY_DN54298_c0_g1_i1.p1 TRINITY_DN54298_c0_g1~~TRINITY_DN54298_c0_g1_i1.p1  ORF type:complete len:835 (-),score=130.38 TRINITY_DN54298_c0_g1_i1:106-2610(-)